MTRSVIIWSYKFRLCWLSIYQNNMMKTEAQASQSRNTFAFSVHSSIMRKLSPGIVISISTFCYHLNRRKMRQPVTSTHMLAHSIDTQYSYFVWVTGRNVSEATENSMLRSCHWLNNSWIKWAFAVFFHWQRSIH